MKADVLVSQLAPLHADAHGWALHCCGGEAARAEDVLQTAYLKVLADRVRSPLATEGAPLKTWWFGVIRFTALEEARRARLRESLPARLWRRLLPEAPGEVDPRPHPATRIDLDERARQLRAALAQLPARQAEVLHLVFYQDLTVTEAAAVMGVSVGSARQHYERGKARLRERLQPLSPAACHD